VDRVPIETVRQGLAELSNDRIGGVGESLCGQEELNAWAIVIVGRHFRVLPKDFRSQPDPGCGVWQLGKTLAYYWLDQMFEETL
jgi:hypothetical protein